jgi:hypothetical protein
LKKEAMVYGTTERKCTSQLEVGVGDRDYRRRKEGKEEGWARPKAQTAPLTASSREVWA